MPDVSDTARHTLRILVHTRSWVDPHAAGLPLEALAELSRAGLVEVVSSQAGGRLRLRARATDAGRAAGERAA